MCVRVCVCVCVYNNLCDCVEMWSVCECGVSHFQAQAHRKACMYRVRMCNTSLHIPLPIPQSLHSMSARGLREHRGRVTMRDMATIINRSPC
jgi:hypothetical protein